MRKPRPVAAAPSDESHCFLQSPSLQSSPGSGNMKLQSGTPHCCSAAAFKTLCQRKRALVRAGRTRRSTPAVYALLFSSAVPQEIFGKVLSYVYFGPSSTTPPRPWDPSRDERGDTEYWRTYLALEGLPVPDDLNDIPFGDPKELPGWVEDESTSDY